MEGRGTTEAFAWGFGLSLVGVVIVAILWSQFTKAERPLHSALWGMTINAGILVFLLGLAGGVWP